MERQSDWAALALIAVLGVVLFVTVDYSGDYAINDDWGYAAPVRWWHEMGALQLSAWQSMPLLTQIGLGIAWTEAFGYSQEALRSLTLTLALVTSLAVYGIARRLDLPSGVALLAAVLPLASPVFLGLSYTFMTDVPFAAIMCVALYFFVRSFTGGGEGSFALGVIFLLLAVLLRQTALALAVAIVLAEPAARGYSPLRFVRSLVVLGVAIATYLVSADVIETSIGLPYYYDLKSDAVLRFALAALTADVETLLGAARAFLKASAILGVVLLPFLPLLWPRRGQFGFLGYGSGIIVLAALTYGSALLEAGVLFPYPGDGLTAIGLGPRHLEGPLPDAGVYAITATGLGHAVTVLAAFTAFRKAPRTNGAARLLALTATILYAPHVIADTWLFDRYAILPALLFALVVLTRIRPDGPVRLALATAATIASVALGLLLVQDFFRWQDARYDLIASLDRPADQIDGGFEFNNRAVLLTNPPEPHRLQLVSTTGRPIRIVKRPRLADTVIDTREVPQLLGLRTATIYAVE